MPSRRSLVFGALAAGLCPSTGWAQAGSPAFVAAARNPDGAYALYGLSKAGEAVFNLPLPGRGHAAAAHPGKPVAVAFARRPGDFAIIIDCATGTMVATLRTPAGRHFYGHGAYSADGRLLYTTENDFENARGRIGVWDVAVGYRRIGEHDSGGVGPHEIVRMPDGQTLAVANGGIETHPDSGRAKLNIATMRPNLSYVSLDGGIVDQIELDVTLHKNSIRHLAASDDGTVAFAMQWQGEGGEQPPLVGTHRRGAAANLLTGGSEDHRAMENYVGSIAFSGDGTRIAATSPRGGLVQVFDAQIGRYLGSVRSRDVSGVGALGDGFAATSGTGLLMVIDGTVAVRTARHAVAWDNHLVPVGA